MRIIAHGITITRHKFLVGKYCFRCGLYWQGLTHDLSKYSFCEFWRGAKYYQGTRSPNVRERELLGYSAAWLHHKGRNRHHYEYWIDLDKNTGRYAPLEMPLRYVIEMFCDRMAACKVYLGKDYTDSSALDYFMRERSLVNMHPRTSELLEKMLTCLADNGEDAAFDFCRNMLKNKKKG